MTTRDPVEARNVELMTADEVARAFALSPHPEGGLFRETFRDDAHVTRDGHPRSAGTAIYFLLREGETSRWHSVDAAEIWHFYAGAPLALDIAAANEKPTRHVLGTAVHLGQHPQVVVPPNHWQRAASLGAWTLVGCTVSPGFLFERFKLAEDGFEPGR